MTSANASAMANAIDSTCVLISVIAVGPPQTYSPTSSPAHSTHHYACVRPMHVVGPNGARVSREEVRARVTLPLLLA